MRKSGLVSIAVNLFGPYDIFPLITGIFCEDIVSVYTGPLDNILIDIESELVSVNLCNADLDRILHRIIKSIKHINKSQESHTVHMLNLTGVRS